jgi:hypothetical protein
MHLVKRAILVLSVLSLAPVAVTPPAAASLHPPGEAEPATAAGTRLADASCTTPVWSSSTSGDLYVDGGYILHNNMWNAAGYDLTQTMGVCDHASWYVDVTTPAGTDSAVKSYPNVHVDYHNWSTGYEPPLPSFKTIMSSYAGQGPGVGVYNVAYDIWLNGVGGGADEVMIWTENRGQRPAGSEVASNVTISDLTWDVWATTSNSYIAFVPPNGQSYPSGTLNLKSFLNYLTRQGRLASTSTLGQIGYGIEVVSTEGQTTRFNCTNFSLKTHQRLQ